MVVLLIQSGQKWHLHISLEVQWLVAEELGHNSAFVWAVSPPLERLISLQDSFFFAYKMKTVLEEFFSFTKRCWLAGSRSRHLCYCLFHYPHSHQPHPSCPPPSLWALWPLSITFSAGPYFRVEWAQAAWVTYNKQRSWALPREVYKSPLLLFVQE